MPDRFAPDHKPIKVPKGAWPQMLPTTERLNGRVFSPKENSLIFKAAVDKLRQLHKFVKPSSSLSSP